MGHDGITATGEGRRSHAPKLAGFRMTEGIDPAKDSIQPLRFHCTGDLPVGHAKGAQLAPSNDPVLRSG
jgi:hypothetical protein